MDHSSPLKRRIVMTGAVLTSAVGVLMAAAAATDRGATLVDRALIVAVACVLVLGAHLLPSISRSAVARALWIGCLLLTAWGHSVFFISAAQRAGAMRAGEVTESSRAQALRAELESIAARPVATVAADVAAALSRSATTASTLARCEASTPGRCATAGAAMATAQARLGAVHDELAQARHAAELRTQLSALAGEQDNSRTAAAADPVAGALASVTGMPATGLSTAVAVLSSLMVELLACLLWSVAMKPLAVAVGGKPANHQATPAIAARLSAMAGRWVAAGAALTRARDSPGTRTARQRTSLHPRYSQTASTAK